LYISVLRNLIFKWSYGLGGGPNYSKTDVVKGNWGHTAYGELNYHFTPFVTAGIEAQYGMVRVEIYATVRITGNL
jgi:hypothetical protein